MTDTNTVTITLEEYMELRQKAEMNAYLMTELGRIEARFLSIDHRIDGIDNRVWSIEQKRGADND